jgi:cytoskeletal protein RodZ
MGRLMKEDRSVLGLATIRHNRGISLEQIAESTKIGVRSLEAIERGEFRKLPGGIYNTSYIRQYARAIDYDEGALLAFYYQAIGIENPAGARRGERVVSGLRPTSAIAEN